MKALDLSAYVSKTWEITLPDAETKINLRKPTQDDAIFLEENIKLLESTEDNYKALDIIRSLLTRILNTNIEKKVFDAEYIDNLSIDMALAIVYGYKDFLTELQSSKNFKSPQ